MVEWGYSEEEGRRKKKRTMPSSSHLRDSVGIQWVYSEEEEEDEEEEEEEDALLL